MADTRVDLERVLALLDDEKYEIEWDACWDTLKLLDGSYREYENLLLSALRAEKTSFGRLYAMEALIKIGLPSESIAEAFLPLLKDDDYEVQLEALKWMGSREHQTQKIRAGLWSLLAARGVSIFLKFRSALILLSK